jgi:HK97 family phage major capsid protein
MPEINELIKTEFRSVSDHFDLRIAAEAAERKKLAGYIDRLEQRMGAPGSRSSGSGSASEAVANITAAIQQAPGFDSLRKSGAGRLICECPSILETKTLSSTGLVNPQTLPGIADSGRQDLRVRSLIQSLPIETGSAFFLQETTLTPNASPQVQASAKNEQTLSLQGVTTPVETVAVWTGVSRQALDDIVSLQNFIDTTLRYAVEFEVEKQILTGSGVSPFLTGLIPAATSYNTALTSGVTAVQQADKLRGAITQLQLAGRRANGIVLNPQDWQNIELLKASTTNEYLLASVRQMLAEILWSRTVVTSTFVPSGKFLVGDFSAAHIRERMGMTLDISDSHASFFIQNLIAVRVEIRLALCITSLNGYVYGSF